MKLNFLLKILAVASINIGAGCLAPMVAAQEALTFEATAFVEKIVMEDGTETIVQLPTDTVVPGDVIVFNTVYRNVSAGTVEDFIVTNPIPVAVVLTANAAADLTVSVDGGATFGALSSLKIAAEPNGVRPAVTADVTHIRWTLAAVAPGESGTLSYKAFVR